MPIELFFAFLILAVLLIGSYTDIRTREVPDWVNYGFIFTAIAVRGIWSAAYHDITYIAEGVFGLFVFVALAYAVFYAGQWGGGDAKMIMGLGAMMGFSLDFNAFLVSFFFNVFLIGAVYALIWSIVLAVKHRKKFSQEFRKLACTKKMVMMRKIILISAAILLVAAFLIDDLSLKPLLFGMVFLYAGTFYLWIFVRVIERSCMLKLVPPEKLTEGDWIAKDVIVGKKRITGPKDLGISKEQIAPLKKLRRQKKIKLILIKEGIPFVPSFLLAFIATWVWGNLFLLIL